MEAHQIASVSSISSPQFHPYYYWQGPDASPCIGALPLCLFATRRFPPPVLALSPLFLVSLLGFLRFLPLFLGFLSLVFLRFLPSFLGFLCLVFLRFLPLFLGFLWFCFLVFCFSFVFRASIFCFSCFGFSFSCFGFWGLCGLLLGSSLYPLSPAHHSPLSQASITASIAR